MDIKFSDTSWVIVLFMFTLFGCEEQKKFKTIKWIYYTNPLYPPPDRTKMLKDLTMNYKLVGLTYPQLLKLLGPPNFKDSAGVSYAIELKLGLIDPIYTKYLNFTYSKDSIITSFKVQEWHEK